MIDNNKNIRRINPMKYYLTAVLLLAFSQFNVFGQSSDRYQPIQQDQEFSPYQRNVPFEFQFLIEDDLTSILFNPAMLSKIDSNQTYITVYPGSNQNYRLAYLSANKWFSSISFRNIYSDAFSVNESFSNEITSRVSGDFSYSNTKVIEIISEDDRENSTNFLELRVAKLLKSTTEKSSAIGFYIAYSNQNYKAIRNNRSILTTTGMVFEADTLVENNNSGRDYRNLSIGESPSDKILFGLDYSHSSQETQHSHRLYGQFNDYESNSSSLRLDIRNSGRSFFDGRDSLFNIDRIEQNRVSLTESTPWVIGYQGYLNRAVNWLSNDYVFASINSYYGFDQAELKFSEISEVLDVNNGVPQSINNIERVFEKPDGNGYEASAKLAFGYGLKVPFQDGYFFTGLSQSFQYVQSEGYLVNQNFGLVKYDDTFHFYDALIPVFGEIALTDWISLFSGANMLFSYSASNSKQRLTDSIEDTNLIENDFIQKRTSARFQDNTSTYFGLKATHKSGLKVLADINGDLARVSGWYITLGYSF